MIQVLSPAPHRPASTPTTRPYAADGFAEEFLTRVLHRDRIVAAVDRLLGAGFELGPFGAGPGRKVAAATAKGTYLGARGTCLDPETGPGYRIVVPAAVRFDLDLRVDRLTFDADVHIPLRVQMGIAAPLTLTLDITPPDVEEVELRVRSTTRRGEILRRSIGLDEELRAFVVRFTHRELTKPHIVAATRIDLAGAIDGVWPQLADQFLPPAP